MDLTFEELYRGHRDDVFRAALRELGNVHDAEDVTQAAFVDAYRAVLRGTQPQSPRAWLLAIAENVRNRRFRTAQRRPQEQPLDADFPLAADLPYEQALAEALMALPPAQRRVFVLRELVGRSYDEIADEVGSTVASVQMLLFRARRALREQLDPPVVARRRPGLVVPVPGWLTSLCARVEVSALSPRAAGAVGAAAVAVLGATVAVPQAPADRRPVPPMTERAIRAAPTGTVASSASRPVRARPARVRTRSARLASSPTVAPPTSRPIARTSRAASPAPEVAVAAAPVSEQASAASPAAPPLLTPIAPVSEVAVEPPALPVAVETATAVVPELSVPSLPPSLPPALPPAPSLPQLPSLPAAEVATGAAGAAGADAPPLPVPSLPLETLPPAP